MYKRQHRHLLAEYGPDGQLVAVAGARGAQSAAPGDEHGEQRVLAEVVGDRVRIGVQVEQAAHALGGGGQIAQFAQVQPAFQPAAAAAVRAAAGPFVDLGDAGAAGQAQGAAVGAGAALTEDFLDAGQGAPLEVVEDLGGGVRPAEGEAQRYAAGAGGLGHRAEPGGLSGAGGAQLGGRQGVDLANGVVELPHAGESGGEGDLGDGQRGGLEQYPRGVGALGAGEGHRAGAEFGVELALELAGAVAQAAGESGDALAVDDAVADQPHGAADHIGADVPGGGAGHGVGAAAAAGPEAGALGGGRGGEEADVLRFGGGGRAAGTAVDPGRGDGEEEVAVEPRIAAAHRLVFAAFAHPPSTVRQPPGRRWRKSDAVFALGGRVGRWGG